MPKQEKLSTDLFGKRDILGSMLLIALISIGLTFFAFVSSMLYLSNLKKIAWSGGKLPTIFWLSTVLIALSSFTLEQAGKYIKRDDFLAYRRMLMLTWWLGIVFIAFQVWGWFALQAKGIYLKGGFLGAFVYILSGFHILHVVGGLIFLGWRLQVSYKNKSYIDSFVYNINPPNQLKWKLLARYWHFIGIVWIALFLFFLFKGFTTF